MVIKDLQLPHAQARLAIIEIHINCIVRYAYHPEHVVGVDVHIEIVNLFRKCGRSSRTGVHIKSNKGECAVVASAVSADKFSLTESHVRLVRQRRSSSCGGVEPSSAATNVGQTDEPVEVRYLRRIADVRQCHGRVQWIVVDEDRERFEWCDTSRNRIKEVTLWVF